MTNGRLSSLIELGAGFHPDLTGRENIYLNGVILGLTRHLIKQRFDDIVAFAELERFIDMPVKRYSSGMYVRLGFAVAAHVDADVLLIDEVLAVGDASFQARCLDRINQLKSMGKTIVFVSHNLFAVQGVCTRAILITHGVISASGAPREVIQRYSSLANDEVAHGPSWAEGDEPLKTTVLSPHPARITDVKLLDKNGMRRDVFKLGDGMRIRISFVADKVLREPIFSIGIIRPDSLTCCAASTKESMIIPQICGPGTLEVEIPELNLVPGTYAVGTWISDRDNVINYHNRQGDVFTVISDLPVDSRWGVFVLHPRWTLSEGGKDGNS